MRSERFSSDDFDHYVRAAISAWETAVELREQWNQFDGEEQASHLEEWPSTNIILRRLSEYVAKHKLTEDQKAQWAKLRKLVAEHEKDLEEMGYRVSVPASVRGREAA
jgi:hypothetical protein